jgi:phosphoribosylglycinamide formyltransferase 1
MTEGARPVRTVLFASGGGSNVQALLDAGGASWTPVLLVSDRDGAPVLELAHERNVPVAVIPAGDDFEARLLAALEDASAELLVLAGYLRLVPAAIVRRWEGRMLNVHPALLPAFGGKGMYGRKIHEAVLAARSTVTGVTVHLVDERFDEGPIVAQWPVPVHPDDTPESLAARVLTTEHTLYPLVVDHVARALTRGERPRPLLPPDLTRHGLEFP